MVALLVGDLFKIVLQVLESIDLDVDIVYEV